MFKHFRDPGDHLTASRADPSVCSVVRLTSSRLRVPLCVWFLENLVGFVIYVVEQHEAASAQCARPAGWRQWLEWPLAGVVGRPPPKRRLQCYYDIYRRHERAKNEVVRASWGPVHHMATA